MADISADTLAELSRATSIVNTRVRYDEQIELSSDNLLSNPDMRDFVDGEPDNITLGAPAEPVGWGVLIRKIRDGSGTWLKDTHLSHQDTGPLPMDRDFYYQKTDVVDGAPPQDATKRAKIAAPTAFFVKVEGKDNTQLSGGTHALAVGWIMGKTRKASNPNIQKSPFLTNPSPRASMVITGGQSIVVSFDSMSPPEGAVGMYVAATPRLDTNATPAQIAAADLYIQRRFDIRKGMPTSWEYNGPFRRSRKAPTTNKTFQGGFNNWGAPRWRRKRMTKHRVSGFITKLSWRYMTEVGPSRPQGTTKEIGTGRFVGTRKGLFWRPVKRPTNAKMWQPLYYNKGMETWFAMDWRPFDQWAVLHHTNPEHGAEGKRPEEFEFNKATTEEDTTGIPRPDSAPTLTLGEDSDLLDPGTYRVRTVFYDEDGNETATSFAVDRKIALGQTLKISRPHVGNILYNSDGHEWEVTLDRSLGWEHVATRGSLGVGTLAYGFQMRNTFLISDTSQQSGENVVAKSAWSDMPDDYASVPYSIRVLSDFPTGSPTGILRVWIETRARASISQDTPPVASDFPGNVIPVNTLWEDTRPVTGSGRAGMGGVGVHDDVSVLRQWNGTAWTFPSPDVHNTAQGRAQKTISSGARGDLRIALLRTVDPDREIVADEKGWVKLPTYPANASRPNSEGAQIRVVYALAGTRNVSNLKVHFLGKMAGESYPRTFPSEDEADAPTVEIPSEIQSPNVANQLDLEPYSYRRRGGCKIAWVEDSDRNAQAPLVGKQMRFVEYWAGYGTPRDDAHGFRGYTTPVNGSTQYTLRGYLEFRGVTVMTDVLHVGSFDSKGNLLQNHGPLLSSAQGDRALTPTTAKTFTTHADARYIRIYKGGFSDGFWRTGGFMLNTGATALSYTNHNETSGSRVYKFDTGVAGNEDGALEFLGEVAEWLGAGATYTDNDPLASGDDYDAAEPDTAVLVDFKTSEDENSGYQSSWISNFADVPKLRYWQIRLRLSSETNTASPLVDSVGISVVRPYIQLLRPDGKEYGVPVQVTDWPVPTPERQREMFLSDNNTPRFNLRGRDLHYAEGFGLETYSDAAVRAVNWGAVREDGLHLVEDYYANRTYEIWLENSPRWAVDREVYNEWDPYYIHHADSLSAVVTDMESITGDPIPYDDQ